MAWLLPLELRYKNELAPEPAAREHSPGTNWGERAPVAYIWLGARAFHHDYTGPKPCMVLKLIHGDRSPEPRSGYSSYDEDYIYKVELHSDAARLRSCLNQRVVVGIQVYAHSRNQDGDSYHAPAGAAVIDITRLWENKESGKWHSLPLLEHIDSGCKRAHLPAEAEDSDPDSDHEEDEDVEAGVARRAFSRLDATSTQQQAPEYARPPTTFLKGEVQIRLSSYALLPAGVRVEHNPKLQDYSNIRLRMQQLIIQGMQGMYEGSIRPLSESITGIQCPTFAGIRMPLPGGAWALIRPPITASSDEQRNARVQVMLLFMRAALSISGWSEEQYITVVQEQLSLYRSKELLPGFVEACNILALYCVLFSNSLPYTDDVMDVRRRSSLPSKMLKPEVRSADKYMDPRKLYGGDCDDLGKAATDIYYELTRADLGPDPPPVLAAARLLGRTCYFDIIPHTKVNTASADQQNKKFEQAAAAGISEADQPGINHIHGFLLPVASVVTWLRMGALSMGRRHFQTPAQLKREELDPSSPKYSPWLSDIPVLTLEGTGLLAGCMLPRQLWPGESREAAALAGQRQVLATILRKQLEAELPDLGGLKKPLIPANEGYDETDLEMHPARQPFYEIMVGAYTGELLEPPHGILPVEEKKKKERRHVISFYFVSRAGLGRPDDRHLTQERASKWVWGVGINSLVLSSLRRDVRSQIGIVPDIELSSSELHILQEILDEEPPVPLLCPAPLERGTGQLTHSAWLFELSRLNELRLQVASKLPHPPTDPNSPAAALSSRLSYFITRSHLSYKTEVSELITKLSKLKKNKLVGAELIFHFAVATCLQSDRGHALLAELRLYMMLDAENITRM